MKGFPPVFYITHAASPRADRIRNHARELNIHAREVGAVFVKMETFWPAEYDRKERLVRLGYDMRPGEIGCFMAHRRAWEAFMTSGMPVCLVLEDDAILPESTRTSVAEAAKTIIGLPYLIRIYSEPARNWRAWRELPSGGYIGRPVSAGNTAVAYLVSREGCQRLLDCSNQIWCPVDDFMNQEREHGCFVFHLEPAGALHAHGGHSIIGARTKPPVGWITRARREIFRAANSMCNYAHRNYINMKLGIFFTRSRPSLTTERSS